MAKVLPPSKEDAVFKDFILDLSNLELRARNLGYPQTAHMLQGAINTAGWERVRFLEIQKDRLEEEKARAKKNSGKKNGGYARAKKLSPERRIEIAVKAAKSRWGK